MNLIKKGQSLFTKRLSTFLQQSSLMKYSTSLPPDIYRKKETSLVPLKKPPIPFLLPEKEMSGHIAETMRGGIVSKDQLLVQYRTPGRTDLGNYFSPHIPGKKDVSPWQLGISPVASVKSFDPPGPNLLTTGKYPGMLMGTPFSGSLIFRTRKEKVLVKSLKDLRVIESTAKPVQDTWSSILGDAPLTSGGGEQIRMHPSDKSSLRIVTTAKDWEKI